MKLAASSEFHLWSWDIQQRKLRFSPFEQNGMAFTLVVAESDILPIDVPVARLQLSDQLAFGYLVASQKPIWADIVGKCGKQKRIFPKLAEHGTELPQILPQQRLALLACNCLCRILFARLQLMTICYIRMVPFGMPALEELDAAHRPLKPWQAIYPCRLHAVALCKQRADRKEHTADSHEYPHHHDKGLKLPMGTTDRVSSFTFWLLKSNSSS